MVSTPRRPGQTQDPEETTHREPRIKKKHFLNTRCLYHENKVVGQLLELRCESGVAVGSVTVAKIMELLKLGTSENEIIDLGKCKEHDLYLFFLKCPLWHSSQPGTFKEEPGSFSSQDTLGLHCPSFLRSRVYIRNVKKLKYIKNVHLSRSVLFLSCYLRFHAMFTVIYPDYTVY